MGKLLKAIFGLITKELFPVIEMLFLSYFIGELLQSDSLKIIIFIALVITSLILHSLFRSIAWGVLAYLMVVVPQSIYSMSHISQSFRTIVAVIFAIAIGVIRFGIGKIIRR